MGNWEDLMKWDPTDPTRPAFPYNKNTCLSIRNHVPPQPYGIGYRMDSWPKQADRFEIIKSTHTEWCLQHPLAETPPHQEQTTHKLFIIDGIACTDGRGPQLVRCRLDAQDRGQIYVAKIYDALYYPFRNKHNGLPVDVTWKADHDYGREAAAYEELARGRVDGKFTPKYYGSWTFDTMLAGAVRPVRLILMEWIQGISMYSLLEEGKTHLFLPEERLEIFAQALEVECRIAWYNVFQEDFAPRNVMLVGFNDKDRTYERILLIDFNECNVVTKENSKGYGQPTPLPISPRYRYWDCCPEEFEAWMPKPHCCDDTVFKGWLKIRWGGTLPSFLARTVA
ncbi:hypothetical protein PT974_01123 [Cladobotryum mycophilum]|uniref:Protein kinase domain-containing protein n=1 Tax=Cladobotryum mycophilum TaxID=491253 RepID=A0ABR0T2T2_9HYPO